MTSFSELHKIRKTIIRAVTVAQAAEEYTLARELLEIAHTVQKKIEGKRASMKSRTSRRRRR